MDVFLWISNKKMPYKLNPFLQLIGTKPMVMGWARGGEEQNKISVFQGEIISQNFSSIILFPLKWKMKLNVEEHGQKGLQGTIL